MFFCTAAFCGASFIWLTETEFEGEELWNPTDLQGYKDRRAMKEIFPHEGLGTTMLFDKNEGNVLSRIFLQELYHLSTTMDTVYRYQELCNRPTPVAPCPRVTILKAWDHDLEKIKADPDLFVTVNNYLLNTPLGVEKESVSVLRDTSGMTKKINNFFYLQNTGNITKVLATIEIFVYQSDQKLLVRSLEKGFLDVIANWESVDGVEAVALASSSFGAEIARVVQDDVMLVAFSIVLVILFCGFLLGDGTIVGSRLLLGSAGAALMLCAFVYGVGVLGAIGEKKTPATPLVLFVLIGIGVDDVIIIVDCYNANFYLESRRKRMMRSLSTSGPAITLTTVTDIVAFAVGSFATMPAVRNFTLTALLVIVFDFLLQTTVFLIALDFDQQRVDANRVDLIPCIQVEDRYMSLHSFLKMMFCKKKYREEVSAKEEARREEEKALLSQGRRVSVRVEAVAGAGKMLNAPLIPTASFLLKANTPGPQLSSVNETETVCDSSGASSIGGSSHSSLFNITPLPNSVNLEGSAVELKRPSVVVVTQAAEGQEVILKASNAKRKKSFLTKKVIEPNELEAIMKKVGDDLTFYNPAPKVALQNEQSGEIPQVCIIKTEHDLAVQNVDADDNPQGFGIPTVQSFVIGETSDNGTHPGTGENTPQGTELSFVLPPLTTSLDTPVPNAPKAVLHKRNSAKTDRDNEEREDIPMPKNPLTTKRVEEEVEFIQERKRRSVHPEELGKKSGCSISAFIEHYYGPAVTSMVGRSIIVLAFLAFTGFNISRLPELKEGLSSKDTLPSDSYVTTYFELQEQYYSGNPGTIHVVFPQQGIRWEDPQTARDMVLLKTMLEADASIISFAPWYLMFVEYMQDYHNVTLEDPSYEKMFSPLLEGFIDMFPYINHQMNYYTYNGSIVVQDVMFSGKQRIMDRSKEKAVDMENVRTIFTRWRTITGYQEGYVTARWYPFTDADRVIAKLIIENLVFSACAVMFALLFFMPPLMAMLVTFTVGLIDLSILGWMWATSVNMSAVSYIVIAMSIGLSVDYCAHIGIAFTNCRLSEDAETRRVGLLSASAYARRALDEIGGSVLAGGGSTLLGLLPLAFASSQTFLMFFKMLFAAVMFGMLHGFVFFPAFLACLPKWLIRFVIVDPL